jgi:hypothetical protein
MLRMLSERKRMAWCREAVGTRVDVLTESTVEEGLRYGFTDAFLRVGVPADGIPENVLARVKITGAHAERCSGDVEEIIG